MKVDFYHLTGAPVEAVLPRIAERLLEERGRLLVVTEDDALAARIDAQLWSWKPESFIPHGRDDAPAQPVLIAASPEPANGARNIALADGIWRDAALGYDRAFHFFGDDHCEGCANALSHFGLGDGDRDGTVSVNFDPYIRFEAERRLLLRRSKKRTFSKIGREYHTDPYCRNTNDEAAPRRIRNV